MPTSWQEVKENHLNGGANGAMMHMSTKNSQMTKNIQLYAFTARISQPVAGLKVYSTHARSIGATLALNDLIIKKNLMSLLLWI